MARFCAICGAEMVDTAAFCPRCGRRTGTSSGHSPTTAAAAPAYAEGQANVAGLLSYFFFPAVIFLIWGRYKRNSFVRFHSFQSIFLWIIFVAVDLLLAAVPVANLFLLPVVGMGQIVVGSICMVKAFQGEFFKLPLLGILALGRANR